MREVDAVVVGSGAGGSMVAHTLARAGARVVVLEKGPNYFRGLGSRFGLRTALFSNDEIKIQRRVMLGPDPLVEPRTFRNYESDGARLAVGEVNATPTTVGGASVTADLAARRCQPADFRMATLLGPVPGADFQDWPVGLDDLVPDYAAAERIAGVQGPGAGPFETPRGPHPMPPGLPRYASLLAADAARRLGWQPFPIPLAINSRPYRGRPACVDCGFCGGYGCPINAKGSGGVILHEALRTGRCELRPECFAFEVTTDPAGLRATGVSYLDPRGRRRHQPARAVVLAGSAIESVRLCLLSATGRQASGLGDHNGLLGRRLMFHFQTIAFGALEADLHVHRGRDSNSHVMDDFTGKDGRGLVDPATRPIGGTIELNGVQWPIAEALIYPWGKDHKAFMRESPFRRHLLVLTMQGEDAPVLSNRVDLDPDVRDVYGFPVARVTYASQPFELDASRHYGPLMVQILEAAGVGFRGIVTIPLPPGSVPPGGDVPLDIVPDSKHILGGLWMGADPERSITDAYGKFHSVDGLYCADGALFTTSTGMNPVLTIWALARRVGRGILGRR